MKNKKNLIIISVVVICILAVIIGICFLGGEDKTETRIKAKKLKLSENTLMNTVDEYKEIINKDLENSDYPEFSINKFEKVTSKDIGTENTSCIYNLYKTDITEDLQIYLLTDDTNTHIEQIRFRVEIGSDDVTLNGYLLGATMRLLYGNVSDEELNSIVENLGLALPLEGNNKTYEFKDDIYRATVKNNYFTTYITFYNSKNFEEKFINILSEEEKKDNEEALKLEQEKLALQEELAKIEDAQELYFDNTDIRWGMSVEELEDVKSVYKNYKDWKNAEGKVVNYYYKTVYSNSYKLEDIQYWFYKDTNKLNSCMLKFYDTAGTYSKYEEIRDVLIEKYGQPTAEKLNFSDETYKNDLEKSLKYKYLEIRTTWTNQAGFDIIIEWGDSLYTITYCEKGYKGNY